MTPSAAAPAARRGDGMDELGEQAQPVVEQARLTTGPVGRTLAALAGPMLIGHFSVVAFNLTDTFFVSRLGTDALAAMSFTFPVVMFIGSLAVGLGIGTSSVISRAIGHGDQHRVRRLTTNALMLGVLVVAVFVLAGLATIRPLFGAMGARGEVLHLVEQYMTVWYVGMVFVVVPTVGNYAIRSTGDAISPSAIMIGANVGNLALDPLLIFGLLGLPRMGIVGAAAATVIARALSLVASLAVLHFGKRMLLLSRPHAAELWRSWGQVLYVGLPAATTILLRPVSLGVITRMVASFGPAAVAAIGAGGRVEMFAMMLVIALASVIVPFVGQNWGAARFDRVRAAHRLAGWFAFAWGLLCLVAFYVAARPVARLFSDEAAVIDNLALYLRIVPLGYGLMGVSVVICSGMNAINRPLHATAVNVIRMLVLTIPLAVLGGWWLGVGGIFAAMALANILAGALSVPWLGRLHRAAMARG